MLGPIRLKGAEIVRISQLGPESLENRPVMLLGLVADRLVQVAHQVGNETVAVEQRVVDVEKVDDGWPHDSTVAPSIPLPFVQIRFFAVQADVEPRAFLLFGGPKRRDETDDLEQYEAHDAAVNRDGQHRGRLNNELGRI